jgi:hypothetical protein
MGTFISNPTAALLILAEWLLVMRLRLKFPGAFLPEGCFVLRIASDSNPLSFRWKGN